MELNILADTILKPGTQDSSDLPASELAQVKEGKSFPILAYRQEGKHTVITFDPDHVDLEELHPSQKNTWYCFSEHIADPAGAEPGNNPRDRVSPGLQQKGQSFELPGFEGVYFFGNTISEQAMNFTWAEALHYHNGGYRKPTGPDVVYGILKIAPVMQQIREIFGRPVLINSWYRDPVTNAAVGGASQSCHMRGDAVDFVVPGYSSHDVFARLDSWWGSQGGLAAGVGFTHIDVRGYKARWSYAGA